MNQKYFEAVQKGVNALVDTKVAVHKHDKVLDDQIDDWKERLVSFIVFVYDDNLTGNILQGKIEGNIQTLQQENNDMKKILNESSNAGAINADTIDAQVFPSNPLSEKLIKYHCKTACIEDAMGVIKKAF